MLTAGDRLGHYEILSLIGKGGMGEVCKAHDARLKRDVAVKVSKDQFTERFTREARAIAALNHPNVCTLYDVGPNFLVMEYVEGSSPKGPMPVEDALRIAQQVAAALEAAHEKNITHRDLKPGNVMIRPDGVVKVLDFGLAKVTAESPPESDATVTLGGTLQGAILGTPAYMAPEQAKGKPADKRADIWAFGVLLYELITGKRLFDGEDLTEVLASVVREQPDLSAVPRPARRLIEECIRKDPAKRLQAIGDRRFVLEQAGGTESPTRAKASFPRMWSMAAAAPLLALLGLGYVHFRETPPTAEPVRFTIPPPEGYQLEANANPRIAVSPDGRTIAFVVADKAGKRTLWVRPLGSSSAQQLNGTEGAEGPFWSPDSRNIAFFADAKLKRVAASGGSLLTLGDAPNGLGGAWSAENVILYGAAVGPLLRVPAAGGIAEPATTLAAGDLAHQWPQFLPDGKRFLYLRSGQKREVVVQTVGIQDSRTLAESAYRPMFAPPDHLLFFRGETLLEQRADPDTLELQGEPVSVAGDIATNTTWTRASYSVSSTGVLAYRPGAFAGDVQIASYSRDGKRTGTALARGAYLYIDLSPDGKRIVVERTVQSGVNLWMLELESGVFSPLTVGASLDRDPVWSPDSKRVAYTQLGVKDPGLREVVVGTSGSRPLYSEGGPVLLVEDWSSDGKTLLFRNFSANPAPILTLPMGEQPAPDLKPQKIYETTFSFDTMRISPDGNWIAYRSLESGSAEVYVARYPSFTDKRQISNGGGMQTLWRNDGRELFYLSPDSKLMAVDVRPGATMQTGLPRVLFQTTAEAAPGNYTYSTRDGQRFYVREPVGTTTSVPIQVVLNWPSAIEGSQ